eukprot:TRINITY_DN111379_c0_g1_i1.p1 TRINITY_DN111379_c0_g1~~TRINITY_DN111379_c0_g1_i1.p1  ORF type:complete len:359 (+),score=61.55 TRINITY_DN111379_c0_g1_i1:42-1118(+)
MFGSSPWSKYSAGSNRSPETGSKDAKAVRKAANTASRQPPRTEYQQPRPFGTGGLSPVLDGESRASHRPPVARLSSLSSLQAGDGGGGSNLGQGSGQGRGKQGTPRSAAANSTGQRNQPLVLRSTWPELEIDPKDVEATTWWFTEIESQMSQSIPDARCPYPWLQISEEPQFDEVMDHLSKPFTFEDFKQGWNVQDDSGFAKWCEERSGRIRTDMAMPELGEASTAVRAVASNAGDGLLRAAAEVDQVRDEGMNADFPQQRCQSQSSIGLRPQRGDHGDGRTGMDRSASSAGFGFGFPLRRPSGSSLTPRTLQSQHGGDAAGNSASGSSSWRPLLSMRDSAGQRSSSSRRMRQCYSAR